MGANINYVQCGLGANIDDSHPGALELLKQGAFSVARSFVPGCRTDVDKTMEENSLHY